MKNFTLTLCLCLCVIFISHSQFSNSFNASSLGSDFHLLHSSVAKSQGSSKFYAVASTIENNGLTDIYVTRIDLAGNVVWGRTINMNDEDRALDVMIDGKNDIVITGYTGDHNVKDLYVAKFDKNGNFIKDLQFASERQTVGTRIIQSSKGSGNYYVAGYEYDEEQSFNMIGNGIILQISKDLNTIDWKNNISNTTVNNTVTDIVELPNGNLFLTGSVGGEEYEQVVMACFVNPKVGGRLIANGNLSFNKGDNIALGASAVYDRASDEIWLLFNSGSVHSKPVYTSISNASTKAPKLNSQAFIIPNPGGVTDKTAGLKIVISSGNANSVTIMGYKQETTAPATYSGFGLWAIDVKKTSPFSFIPPSTNTNFTYWNPSGSSTSGIENRGGDVLSLMSPFNNNGAPYFYTPNMMVGNHSGNKFFALSYDDQLTSNIETTMLSFSNNLTFALSGCLLGRDVRLTQEDIYPEKLTIEQDSYEKETFIASPFPQTFFDNAYCAISNIVIGGGNNGSNGGTENISGDANGSFDQNDLTVYPNPATDVVTLSFDSPLQLAAIEILNSVGQVVSRVELNNLFTRRNMDVSSLSNGMYFAKAINANGDQEVKRFLKK